MTSEASLRAFEAFISPSAAMTFARASRAASASAAIARWRDVGRRTSFTSTRSTCNSVLENTCEIFIDLQRNPIFGFQYVTQYPYVSSYDVNNRPVILLI